MSRRSSLQVVVSADPPAAALPLVEPPAPVTAAPPPGVAPGSPLRERLRREMAAGMLVAAEEVFADSGLAKAHVEDIARRAGVAVGTLYNYYKDRDALLAAILTSRVDELTQAFREAAGRTEAGSSRVALLELTRAYFDFAVRRRTFVRILSEGELAQLKDSYPTSAAIPLKSWQTFREFFQAALQRGVGESVLPAEHAGVDLWLFLGLLRGVVMRDLRGASPIGPGDAERLVSVFFDGAAT